MGRSASASCLDLYAQIMEQVEGGDLVVNRGEESRPKEAGEGRDLNTVEGYEAALKLAQVGSHSSHSKSDSLDHP